MRPERETEGRKGGLLLRGGGRINSSGSRRPTQGVTQPVCVTVFRCSIRKLNESNCSELTSQSA